MGSALTPTCVGLKFILRLLICVRLGGMKTGLVVAVLTMIVGSSLGGSLVDDEVGSVVLRGKLKSRAVLGNVGSKVVGTVSNVVDGK